MQWNDNVCLKTKDANISSGDDEFTDIKRTCDHLVNVLKKRRSNSELQTAALNALKTLLAGKYK